LQNNDFDFEGLEEIEIFKNLIQGKITNHG